MKLSAQTRYGTRAMVELAAAWKQGPVSVATLARAQDISPKYLEQIIAKLKKKKLVSVVARKGYCIARDPSTVRLAEVVDALSNSSSVVHCLKNKTQCPRSDICPTREVWDGLDRVINEYLEQIMVSDLVTGCTKTESAE